MNLDIYRHLWGTDAPLETLVPKIKAHGYAGIETGLARVGEREAFHALQTEHGLKLIVMIFTAGASVHEHLDSFRRQIAAAGALSPVFINSHSGADGFSPGQSREFFREAEKIEADAGIQVAHETHRGRILFNPWITRDILEEFSGIKLSADFSHWVCVCERLLDGELDLIKQAAARTLHLHARVGFEQGPQVSDPRAPEFSAHVAAHEAWWDLVWNSQQERGFPVSTLTPEFGPPGYLQTLPYTRQPVADLWEICEWQSKRQRERFAAR